LAAGFCWWASMKDELRKTTVILYDLEPEVETAYAKLHDAFGVLSSCSRTWHIEARGEVRDPKYHAGASAVVKRKQVRVTTGAPPLVKTNVKVPLLPVGRQVLAFMPDRLLVFESDAVGAVSYSTLHLDVAEVRSVEEGAVPEDATVVGRTWRYVNKKGGPDRRFKDNREIPVCAYEQIHLSSSTGLNEVIQVSRRGVGAALAEAISSLQGLRTEENATPAV
ncbi:MAG TPA: hypothetical protein VNL96_01150, partial [Gemmatimonadaceae bacterium]|nr:hypothetical protein [Gemmatimonadaceae bacterium]